jgi:NAD(P)-dependent dehydrogenase (short-subunit alcohol dehydrogenase family)
MNQDTNKNKLAIVTGSSGGIGSPICSKLKDNGYEVIGIDLIPPKKMAPQKFIQFDLSKLEKDDVESKDFFKLLKKYLGKNKIDLLINNAGFQINDDLNKFDLKNWKKTIAVNVEAPLLLINYLFNNFKKHCLIVNVSSIHSELTKPGFLSYSTSKSALSSLTRSLCVNHGDKFRFIAIEPAAIKTGMLKDGFGDNYKTYIESLKKAHPVNKLGKPEEIAELILLLASNNLNFLNGSVIKIDGGISSRLHDPI